MFFDQTLYISEKEKYTQLLVILFHKFKSFVYRQLQDVSPKAFGRDH